MLRARSTTSIEVAHQLIDADMEQITGAKRRVAVSYRIGHELATVWLIHSGLQASRSAGSVGDGCNCVLNEAEAAVSRGGRHPSMDLSGCVSAEDSAWD